MANDGHRIEPVSSLILIPPLKHQMTLGELFSPLNLSFLILKWGFDNTYFIELLY